MLNNLDCTAKRGKAERHHKSASVHFSLSFIVGGSFRLSYRTEHLFKILRALLNALGKFEEINKVFLKGLGKLFLIKQ